uniref:Uncharacterized protein n=1 Tax=Glossina austeni TaxID=7395 RepID=A0A1A9UVE5_GLOAU
MYLIRFSVSGKEPALRTFTEIKQLLDQGKKREVKNILRENSWPINSPIRSQLWPTLCAQHQSKPQMVDGFYWEMVHQVFGTTELSEKPIMLPAFVDAAHCLPYHLTRTGRSVADRIVNVLAYDCPDITSISLACHAVLFVGRNLMESLHNMHMFCIGVLFDY